MADSPAERIKELDKERSQLVDSAKREALERAREAIADLNALGFDYRLAPGQELKASRSKSKAGNGAGKGQVQDKDCSICKMRTQPPHDGRLHRGQRRKAPFTQKELSERGLVKV